NNVPATAYPLIGSFILEWPTNSQNLCGMTSCDSLAKFPTLGPRAYIWISGSLQGVYKAYSNGWYYEDTPMHNKVGCSNYVNNVIDSGGVTSASTWQTVWQTSQCTG
ncbi:MAG TPA: hypothetical protein VJN71_02795, partial [Nitrososphaerales archaeon]|nr:hypothetical protein [Nitrososphaerales archaeon]